MKKLFWSFGNFLGLLEILEKCLATSGSPGVFLNTWKSIWSFENFLGLVKILETCLATSISPLLFENTCKYSEAMRTF